MSNKDFRPRLSEKRYKRLQDLENHKNVLIIGDLHSPFILDGYLEHCKAVYDRFACNEVIFIGDVIDNHYSSYHETDPDGLGAGDELSVAIRKLKPFYDTFPNATVTIGNHDLVIMRKAFSSGLSKRWIKGLADVLEVPKWKFVDEYTLDGVVYTHGTGSSGERPAFNRAVQRRQSYVMGHVHTCAGVQWSVSNHDRIFGMNVGCGIEDKAYAFAYGMHNNKKNIISCGVVLQSGTIPMVIPMEL